jgi:CubicO group peptidase (beta-lactamase class C family)
LLTAILALHTFCPARQTDFDDAELTTFIASQMKVSRVPGLAVGIVRRDRIVYLRGFGTAAGQGVTPQTPFLIGSLSKSFTALAVMQLVEAGKLNLDTQVHQYLPWFRLKDLEASRAITVRHLLNQTSGLPTSAGFFTPDAESLGRTELVHPVGQVYEYCNLNYRILGLLVEAVTGQTYAAYVREHILTPLKMRSTLMTYEDAVEHGLAGGHQYIFGWPAPRPARRYAGYIASSAEDMCHYLIAHLQNGAYEGSPVISPAGLTLLQRPRDDIGSRYGMGWAVGELNGLKLIKHTGLTEDFSSNMSVLPEQGYGIIVLSNVNSFTLHDDMVDGIIRRLHGRQIKSYAPYELILRLSLLITLMFGLAQFLLRLRRWRRLKYPFLIRARAVVIAHLSFGAVMCCLLLAGVPIWANSPLDALIRYQPDVGYGVIFGAVTFGLAGILGVFVKSRPPSPTAA